MIKIKFLDKLFKKNKDVLKENEEEKYRKVFNRHLKNVKEILNTAEWDQTKGQHPVFDYIRVLTLTLSTSLFNESLFENKSPELDSYNSKRISRMDIEKFLRGNGVYSFEDRKYLSSDDLVNNTLDLSRIPIIPCLWKNNYGNLFSIIGENIKGDTDYLTGQQGNRPFKVSINHLNTYYYPLGITLVDNGNHSQFTAMIKNEGETKFYQFIDYSELYEKIEFDGTRFRKKDGTESDNSYSVKNYHQYVYEYHIIGTLFEIGRILKEYPDVFPENIKENFEILEKKYSR